MKKTYESPLATRYASKEMLELFSPDTKFKTWRKLWIALAEAEKELGLNITDEQIEELKLYKDVINYDIAEKKEREVRHDVMAHIHAYGELCPKAKGIIHLGATSCYVVDNTDLIIMKQGLEILKAKILTLISKLSKFAMKYKDMPTLGFTSFPTCSTSNCRKTGMPMDTGPLMDLMTLNIYLQICNSWFKETTGTQASFLDLLMVIMKR